MDARVVDKVRSNMQPERPRIKGFDGIRAIAAFAILLHHTAFGRLHLGVAVNVFFALSGFLIIGILSDARFSIERGASTFAKELARFWLNRTIRIFPVYYLFLSLFLTIGFLSNGRLFDDLTRDYWWYYAYLANFHIGFVAKTWGTFAHAWTLAVEEQFYFIFGVLLLIVRRSYYSILFSIIFFTSAGSLLILHYFGVAPITIYTLPFIGFCFIVVGGSSRFINANVAIDRKIYDSLSWLVAGAICLFAILPKSSHGADPPGIWSVFFPLSPALTRFLLMLLCGLLLWLVSSFQESSLVSFLELQVLQFAGKISYALYVVHYPTAYLVGNFLASYAAAYQAPSIVFLMTFVLSTILSLLSYFVIEEPLKRWKRSSSGARTNFTDDQLCKVAAE